MTEPKKDEVTKTSQQDGSPEENKDQTQVEDTTQKDVETEEQVTISKEEHDKLMKKATDFDGIIEKKRLEKLTSKPEDATTTPSGDDVLEAAKEAAREVVNQSIQQNQSELYTTNLGIAYKQFLASNKWADSDEVIANISKNFKPNGALSEADLLLRLNIAAQNTFPKEYQKALEDKVRATVLADEATITAGDGGTSSSQHQQTIVSEVPTAFDKKQADKFFNGDIARYMKHKPKS